MSVIDPPVQLNEPAGLLPQVRRRDADASLNIGAADRPSFSELLDRQRRVERPEEPAAKAQRNERSERTERTEPAEPAEKPEAAEKTERADRKESVDSRSQESDTSSEAPAKEDAVAAEVEGEEQSKQEANSGDEAAATDVVPTMLQSTLQVNVEAQAQQSAPSATTGAAQSATAASTAQPALAQASNQGQSPPPGIAIVEQAGLAQQHQAQAETGTGGDGESTRQDSRTASQAKAVSSTENAAVAKPAANAASTQPAAPTEAPASSQPTSATSRVAPPTASPTAQFAQPADTDVDPNVARVSRGLSSAIAQRGGSVTLRLTPVDMGTVRIQMQMTGTTLSASFHAESASAHTLLSQQLSSLRQSLEGQGLQVERLTVQSMQAAPSQQGQSGSNAGGQHQQDTTHQQQSANDGRSRGQYSGQQGGSRRDAQTGGEQPRGFSDHFDFQNAADAA